MCAASVPTSISLTDSKSTSTTNLIIKHISGRFDMGPKTPQKASKSFLQWHPAEAFQLWCSSSTEYTTPLLQPPRAFNSYSPAPNRDTSWTRSRSKPKNSAIKYNLTRKDRDKASALYSAARNQRVNTFYRYLTSILIHVPNKYRQSEAYEPIIHRFIDNTCRNQRSLRSLASLPQIKAISTVQR